MKIDTVVIFVDNKNRNNRYHKRKIDPGNKTRKTQLLKQIQWLDSDTSTDIEDNESIGKRILSEIASTSEDSDTCDTDEMEWLDDNLYRQAHMITNLEYV